VLIIVTYKKNFFWTIVVVIGWWSFICQHQLLLIICETMDLCFFVTFSNITMNGYPYGPPCYNVQMQQHPMQQIRPLLIVFDLGLYIALSSLPFFWQNLKPLVFLYIRTPSYNSVLYAVPCIVFLKKVKKVKS